MFIFTIDQEFWTCEVMGRIMCYDHFLGLKEFLSQLNLPYICICLYLQQIKSYERAS
jgi:hypothetical protein